ncbi:hypothetical protein DFH27DRAFT_372508 [Peziza echinospora]|nr:hypothetical protein DFH27DRAFT_372508 [Peziza echinospora]
MTMLNSPKSRCRLLHLAFIFGVLQCLFSSFSAALQVDHSDIRLLETNYNSALSTLDSKADQKLNLAEFLSVVAKDGLRTSAPAEDDKGLKFYLKGFRWNADDEKANPNWEPQGVTTWEDSLNGLGDRPADDSYKTAMAVAWKDTSSTSNKGIRVTFVVNGTAADSAQKRYGHILLVDEPSVSGDEIKFKAIPTSTEAGLIWHGSWLYVTDMKNGIRAFDLSHIWRVKNEVAPGVKYILPQARMYTPSFPERHKTFNFAFIALDRNSTPPGLLVGSWSEDPNQNTLLIKFPMDTSNRPLTIKEGDQLRSNANWAYEIDIERVIGITFANGYYYIARIPAIQGSSQPDRTAKGSLFVWRAGFTVDEAVGVLARAPGGIAYTKDQDELWSVGSRSGFRSIVAVKASNHIKGNNEQPITRTTSTNSATSTPTQADPTSSGLPPTGSLDPSLSEGTSGGGKSKAKIAGPIAGTLIGVGLVTGLIIFLLRKRRRTTKKTEEENTGTGNFYAGGQQGSNADGEIPVVKPELDANGKEQHYSELDTTAVPTEMKADTWENERQRAGRMPIRKPVPATLPAYYESHRGSYMQQPAELPSPT